MKKIFICSALRGDLKTNITMAEEYCRWAMITHGVLPIAPHVYFTRFLDDDSPDERELGIRAGLELLRDCNELWYLATVSQKEWSGRLTWHETSESQFDTFPEVI